MTYKMIALLKNLIIVVLLFISCFVNSQNYLEGRRLYCRSENPEAIRLFEIGIKTLYLNKTLNKKYLKKTSDVFFKAYTIDTTFCDAMFFTGYTLRLLQDEKAIICYYMADSLANNRSAEFKINLAAEALRFNNSEGIELARQKYDEIIKYFPQNPEGYYGFALTSLMIGDTEQGLENIKIAIEKYDMFNFEIKSDVIFLKGMLLSSNGKYSEGLQLLDKCYSKFKNDNNFKVHYSLCLLKVSSENNDEKMKRKSLKYYKAITNKDEIPDNLKPLFIF
jgi:tetratricopeptide (TPR) repeat protein